MKKYKVGIVGASGLVGGRIIEALSARDLPIEEYYLFTSERSAGEKIKINQKEYETIELNEDSANYPMDVAFFAAGGDVSIKYVKKFVDKGIRVIDNSSVFRMGEDVPLIIPEVNREDLSLEKLLISNPNCTTIEALVALKPIYDKYGIERVVFSSYQSVSGSGLDALKDLEEGTKNFYQYQIKDNIIPQIDDFLDNRYTKEEMKMIDESRKILKDKDLKVTATCIRVPLPIGHGLAINLELKKDFDLDELIDTLRGGEGLVVEDDIDKNIYPMPLNAVGSDKVFVGRIRRDESLEKGLHLWVVADNLKKGAGTNAVQIFEEIINLENQEV